MSGLPTTNPVLQPPGMGPNSSYRAGPPMPPLHGQTPGQMKFVPSSMPPMGANPLAGMPGYAPLPMPVPQPPVYTPGAPMTPAGSMASTVPVGVPMSLNSLPTPDQIAPCAFSNHVGPHQPQYPYPPAQNYNTPWQQPPTNQPPQTPPKEEKPPEAPKTDGKRKVIQDDDDWNSIVYQVNSSLKSPDMLTRQGGAKLLARVLTDNPGTYKHAARGQDAIDLSLKVLKDSRALVRIPLEVAFEVGEIDDMPKEVREQLKSVQTQHGLFNFEPTGIEKSLRQYPEPPPEELQPQRPQPRNRGPQPRPGGRLNVVSPA